VGSLGEAVTGADLEQNRVRRTGSVLVSRGELVKLDGQVRAPNAKRPTCGLPASCLILLRRGRPRYGLTWCISRRQPTARSSPPTSADSTEEAAKGFPPTQAERCQHSLLEERRGHTGPAVAVSAGRREKLATLVIEGWDDERIMEDRGVNCSGRGEMEIESVMKVEDDEFTESM